MHSSRDPKIRTSGLSGDIGQETVKLYQFLSTTRIENTEVISRNSLAATSGFRTPANIIRFMLILKRCGVLGS